MKRARRWHGVLIGGALWAAAGIWFRLAVGKSLSMATYLHRPLHSEFLELLGGDWAGLGKLLWPPIALGSDIMVWTVGSIVWLFDPEGWPGEALGRLLLTHPSLDRDLVLIASVIGGTVLCALISSLAKLIRRLPSQPR